MRPKREGPRANFPDIQVYTALNYPYGGKIRWGVRTFDAATDVERTTIARNETLTADWTAGTFVSPQLSTSGDQVGRP